LALNHILFWSSNPDCKKKDFWAQKLAISVAGFLEFLSRFCRDSLTRIEERFDVAEEA
jgi:hypothetical protein